MLLHQRFITRPQLYNLGKTGHDNITHSAFIGRWQHLRQLCNANGWIFPEHPGIRVLMSGHHFQQGGFTSTIESYQRDALASFKLKIDVIKQCARAKAYAKLIEFDQ